MARGVAIRSITTLGDGRVEVAFSEGSPVAPAGQSGAFTYTDQAAIQTAIREMEQSLSVEQLVLLHLAITWLQANGTFGNINQVTNKEMRLDTTAANVLRIV